LGYGGPFTAITILQLQSPYLGGGFLRKWYRKAWKVLVWSAVIIFLIFIRIILFKRDILKGGF